MPTAGGCTFVERSEFGADTAAIIWRKGYDATVLSVAARHVRHADPHAFDLLKIPYPVVVFREMCGTEHLLIGDTGHHLRVDVVAGSVLNGPVLLRYRLFDGFALPAQTLTLHRLVALQQLGRFPQKLFPLEPRAARWMRALQAFDGKRIGATNREIVSALYGERIVQADWHSGPNYLRSRLARALRVATMLVEGGYRNLL